MNGSADPPSHATGGGGDHCDERGAPAENQIQTTKSEQIARRRQKRSRLFGCLGITLIILALLGFGIYSATNFFRSASRGVKTLGEANTLFWQRKFDDAAPIYTKALDEYLSKNNRAMAFANRGWSYANMLRETEALRDYDAALALNPRLPYVVFDRGLTLHRRGEFDRALADYSRALELEPNLLDAYCGRSVIVAHLGRWGDAVSDMSEAIRCDPENPEWFARRGNYYLSNGHLDSALASFESALGLDPENEGGHRGRAEVFARQHNEERGLAEVNEALRAKPDSPRLLSARASIWLDRCQPKKALEDLDAAIDRGRSTALVYAQRAFTEAWLQQYDDALRDVIEAIRRDRYSSVAHYVRGYTYEKQRRYKEAVAEYDRAIQCDSENVGAVTRRALTKSRSGDYESGRQALQQAVKTFPGWVETHLAWAWFLATCPETKYRNGSLAQHEAQLAVDYSARDPYTLDTLAAACAEAGNFSEAEKLEGEALQKLPPVAPGRAEMEQRRTDFAAGKPFREGL